MYVSRGIKQTHTIRHLRNEKGTGAEMRFAIVFGIVPIFLSLVSLPEVFAKDSFSFLKWRVVTVYIPLSSETASSSASFKYIPNGVVLKQVTEVH